MFSFQDINVVLISLPPPFLTIYISPQGVYDFLFSHFLVPGSYKEKRRLQQAAHVAQIPLQ